MSLSKQRGFLTFQLTFQIELERLIEMGNNQGFISDSDVKEMAPNGKAARLYGQPKVHKPIPEGKRIPHVALFAVNLGLIQSLHQNLKTFTLKTFGEKIPTFLEDTAHCLRFLKMPIKWDFLSIVSQ